jgi:hypothetical protein
MKRPQMTSLLRAPTTTALEVDVNWLERSAQHSAIPHILGAARAA